MSDIFKQESQLSAAPRASTEASKNSKDARAKRLKRLRKLTKKSRKSFAETYKISQGTLQNWETARFGGLTEKGAKLILEALKKESIHCTFNWLMYGAGSGPQKSLPTNMADLSGGETNSAYDKKNKISPNAINIEHEAFLASHINPVTFKVQDEAMMPFFSAGELVGGEAVDVNNTSKLLDKICIVKAEGHETMIRRIRAGTEPKTFTLIITNTDDSSTTPVIYNAVLTKAAPVIWSRKEVN